MLLAWFSDPVKVTVSLCSKTLWDERIPNWVETLVCNCLIPFCLIQEKERERDTEAQTARESHLWYSQMRLSDMEWNIPNDSVGRSDQAHPPLFFCIATDGIRVWGAFVVSVLIAGLFFMIPMSPVYSTQNQRLSVQTKPPSQVITFIEPQTLYENMYSGIQAWERAAINNTFCLFQFAAHIKRRRGKMQHSCQGLHSDSTFLLLLWLFVSSS